MILNFRIKFRVYVFIYFWVFFISEKWVDNDFSVVKGYVCNNEIEIVEFIGYINYIL